MHIEMYSRTELPKHDSFLTKPHRDKRFGIMPRNHYEHRTILPLGSTEKTHRQGTIEATQSMHARRGTTQVRTALKQEICTTVQRPNRPTTRHQLRTRPPSLSKPTSQTTQPSTRRPHSVVFALGSPFLKPASARIPSASNLLLASSSAHVWMLNTHGL